LQNSDVRSRILVPAILLSGTFDPDQGYFSSRSLVPLILKADT